MGYKNRVLKQTDYITEWPDKKGTWQKSSARDIISELAKSGHKNFIAYGDSYMPLSEYQKMSGDIIHPGRVTSMRESTAIFLKNQKEGYYASSEFFETYRSKRSEEDHEEILEDWFNDNKIFGFGWKYALRVIMSRIKETLVIWKRK